MTPKEIEELEASTPEIPKKKRGRPPKNPQAAPQPKAEPEAAKKDAPPGEVAELFGAIVATTYTKAIDVASELLEVRITPISDVEAKRIEKLTARVVEKHYGGETPIELLCVMAFAAPLLPRATQITEGVKKRRNKKKRANAPDEPLKPQPQAGANVVDATYSVIQ